MLYNKKSCTDGGNPTKKLNFWGTSHFKFEENTFHIPERWNLICKFYELSKDGMKKLQRKLELLNKPLSTLSC